MSRRTPTALSHHPTPTFLRRRRKPRAILPDLTPPACYKGVPKSPGFDARRWIHRARCPLGGARQQACPVRARSGRETVLVHMRTACAGRLNSGSLSHRELTVVFWFGTGSRRQRLRTKISTVRRTRPAWSASAVASSGIMARASGPAPVASFINLKTHLGSTTSSRRTRRQLSVAARS